MHIVDQMTDVGVIIEFYLLSLNEDKYNYIEKNYSADGRNVRIYEYDYCSGVNTYWLFIMSLLSLFGYRIISSFVLFAGVNIASIFFTQMFDVQIYFAILTNYKCHSDETSNPQRLIQSMEGMFKSFPQILSLVFKFIVVCFTINIFWAKITNWSHKNICFPPSSNIFYFENIFLCGTVQQRIGFFSLAMTTFSVAWKAVSEDKQAIKETELLKYDPKTKNYFYNRRFANTST